MWRCIRNQCHLSEHAPKRHHPVSFAQEGGVWQHQSGFGFLISSFCVCCSLEFWSCVSGKHSVGWSERIGCWGCMLGQISVVVWGCNHILCSRVKADLLNLLVMSISTEWIVLKYPQHGTTLFCSPLRPWLSLWYLMIAINFSLPVDLYHDVSVRPEQWKHRKLWSSSRARLKGCTPCFCSKCRVRSLIQG